MLAYSSVFVWLFMTAWIWGGLLALVLGIYVSNSSNEHYLLRFLVVLFGFAAVQSLLWLVGCGMSGLFKASGFQSTFHWLFNGGANAWWIVSGIGLVFGEIFEMIATNQNETENIGMGITVALVSAVILIFFYGIFKLIGTGVKSVVNYG